MLVNSAELCYPGLVQLGEACLSFLVLFPPLNPKILVEIICCLFTALLIALGGLCFREMV